MFSAKHFWSPGARPFLYLIFFPEVSSSLDFVSFLKFLEKKRMTIKNLPISGGLPGSSGGGGGNELLLYYITRLLKPNIVLESGVSAGASSSAILHALEDNKNGHLISSEIGRAHV